MFFPSASTAFYVRQAYGWDFYDTDVTLSGEKVYVGSMYAGTWDGEILTLDRGKQNLRYMVSGEMAENGIPL